MVNPTAKWLDKHGKPLECVEKIKVLEQNLAEIKNLAMEAVEDARIMGAAEGQVEQALVSIFKEPYNKQNHNKQNHK